MSSTKAWLATSAVVALAVAAVPVYSLTQGSRFKLEHDPAPLISAPAEVVQAAHPQPLAAEKKQSLQSVLDQFAKDERLGHFVGKVTDVADGSTVWESGANEAVRPASNTKILTAAAAITSMDPEKKLETKVVEKQPGTIIIKAAGDVWLTDEKMDELARAVNEAKSAPVDKVLVDTSIWSQETFLNSWGRENIGAGNIAPMQPVMLYGARLGEKTGDVPRSEEPAIDVAKELAKRVGAENTGYEPAENIDPNAQLKEIAKVESPLLNERIRTMMEDSDNVMAEAIGRELALHAGKSNDVAGAIEATTEALQKAGFDTSDLHLVDNSGLSDDNLITPALLDAILYKSASTPQLRPLLETLPIAGATGTMSRRFDDSDARGWVRAKTGTLTDTSALSGYVTSEDGHVYTFAFVSNKSNILDARAALDELASELY